jgi:hypothetical protein
VLNNNNKLLLFFLLTANTFLSLDIESAYAHIPQDNKTSPIQEWKDQQNNIKVQFSYSPDRPLLYKITDLKFSMQA